MKVIRTAAWAAISFCLGAVAPSAAVSQGGTVSLSGQNTYVGPAPDTKTMSAYKKTTWQKHQTALKAGTGTSAIPPTDCPPLPAQDCLDTWDDDKLTTASPSR